MKGFTILIETLAFLVGAVMFAAGLAPEDAESNIHAWIEYLGVNSWAVSLLGLFVCIVAVASVMNGRRNAHREQEDQNTPEHPLITFTSNTISVLPPEVPPDGEVWEYNIRLPRLPPEFHKRTFRGHGPVDWRSFGYRNDLGYVCGCEIENHSDALLREIELPVAVGFYEPKTLDEIGIELHSLRNPATVLPEGYTHRYEWGLRFHGVQLRPGEVLRFWIINSSEHTPYVLFPDTINVKIGGSDRSENVPLIYNSKWRAEGFLATTCVEKIPPPEDSNRRRELIQKWRAMLQNVRARAKYNDMLGQILRVHPDYLSLEPMLSDEARKKVYSESRTTNTYGSALSTIKDEIVRIEREWGL